MKKKFSFKVSDAIKSALVYLVSMLLTKGLSIITMPIFTRIMPTSEIGIVNIYSSWYSILGGIITLGLTSGGLTMCLNKFSDDKDGYLSSVLSLSTLSALIFTTLSVIFYGIISKYIDLPKSLFFLILICFWVCPAYDYWITEQRYSYRYKLSGFVMVISSVLSSLLAVVAVLNASKLERVGQAEARLWGTYLIPICIAAVIWISIIKKGKTFFDREYWKTSLLLSLPLIGQMLAAQVLGVADRIMIEHYCGISKTGIYGTIYTIGTLTTILWTAVNGTFTPFIYKNMKDNQAGIKKSSSYILIAFSIVSVAVVLFGPEVTRILGTEEYLEGIYIIPPVAAGVYLISVGDLYSDLLIYAQKTKYIMAGTMIGAGLNLLLNSIFLPMLGYIAAAYTTLFSYIVMTIFIISFVRRTYQKSELKVNNVYNQKMILVMSVVTIGLNLLISLTYANPVIRYSIAAIYFAVIIILIKKMKLISELKRIFVK